MGSLNGTIKTVIATSSYWLGLAGIIGAAHFYRISEKLFITCAVITAVLLIYPLGKLTLSIVNSIIENDPWTGHVVIGVLAVMLATCIGIFGFINLDDYPIQTISSSDYTAAAETEVIVSYESDTHEETADTALITDVEIPLSIESEGLEIGSAARYGDFFVGLSDVRSLDRIQTAISYYSVDISSDQEVIYPIIQVYNASERLKLFNEYDISVYTDSVRAADPDTAYLVGIDGLKQYQSYEVDPGKSAVIITGHTVQKGWSQMTVFCGSLSWNITPEDINRDSYSLSPIYDITPFPETEDGSVVYNEDYDLIFDCFEIYTYDNVISGPENYAVFEFTLNNTGSSSLDYSLTGYEMRAYCNSVLLDDATYIIDDNINGHSNIFNIDDIAPGMSARIYVAFPLPPGLTGSFECYYDTGYIMNNTIAHIIKGSQL